MQPPSSRPADRVRSGTTRTYLALLAAISTIALVMFFSPAAEMRTATSSAFAQSACATDLVQNGGFEFPTETPNANPLNWRTSQWAATSQMSRDPTTFHSGASSIRIKSTSGNDAWFSQDIVVQPNTIYRLTGWIKTENVSSGAGANLSFVGTWSHTDGIFGSTPWTRVDMLLNSSSSTLITIGARLGYWSGTSTGTAWFDDLRLTPINTDGSHPRWKILVLIYDKTDVFVTDAGVRHHLLAAMTPAEVERATTQATLFVNNDIAALDSGNMVPELTIRYPNHPLRPPDQIFPPWSPSPGDIASDSDPSFDSVIVIWDPRVVDADTGVHSWIGAAAGLASATGRGQTYTAIIIEATGYGHRNVFKHEWGHCILFYFDAMGTAPKPAVTNHTEINQYVHWPTGESYVWLDESDANPIPNSIYNNESGFTHDYYSGFTATADQPTRQLGITPEAWSLGGPVTKPSSMSPPSVITCNGDVTVSTDPGVSWARVSLTPPTDANGCDVDAVGTRSDGLPLDVPYTPGQTVITWNAPNTTASCQQVITVNDTESPFFAHFPKPVTVKTGPGATSCGAIVDESLIATSVTPFNPIETDPLGDAATPSWRTNDIVSTAATYDSEALTFTVTLTDQVFPASSGNMRGLAGYIDIDSDLNTATGRPSVINPFSPAKLNMGVDFEVDLGSEFLHAGLVDVIVKLGGPAIVGKAPIVFNGNSFTVRVPLSLLGDDNGSVRYAVAVGLPGNSQTDSAPSGPIPFLSHALPELIARDNCGGIKITRDGVAANNFFPVGETVITFTATDTSGNAATLTQKVTVIDDTPPVISNASANPATVWPPNRNTVDVTLNYDVTDNCGVRDTSISVSSNDPASSGSDWQIVDGHHMRLLAQHLARGGDRIYTITITANDIHGNVATQDVIVRVAPRNGKGGLRATETTLPPAGTTFGQRVTTAPQPARVQRVRRLFR
jgi:HYR domain-containing protein